MLALDSLGLDLPDPLVLYVSGPMAGFKDHNYPAFAKMAHLLRVAGYNVISPHELGKVAGWEWPDYLRRDLRVLLECSAVATLDGWENSRGASLETTVATKLGMPVWSAEVWINPAGYVSEATADGRKGS